MDALKVLLELQEEITLYCDPNEKVSAMIERFVRIEESLKVKAEEFNNVRS